MVGTADKDLKTHSRATPILLYHEDEGSSKTNVSLYHTTWYHIPGNQNPPPLKLTHRSLDRQLSVCKF
jgi:hypothetical protein